MFRPITFISVLLIFIPSVASALQITSMPHAEVTRDYVLLSDIAKLSESTPLAKALASTRVAGAPKIGKELTLRTKEIQKKLVKAHTLTENIAWDGAANTIITRKGVIVTSEEPLAAIDSFLFEAQNTLPEAEYTFTPRQLPLPFAIPMGELQVDVIPSDPDIIGSNRFSLIYQVNGKTVKNISVRGKLEVMAPVAVVNGTLKRGTILRPEMLSMEERDLATLRTPCTDLREVLGKKLSKRIRKGTVLDLAFVEFPPVIIKGQLVKMVVNHKGLQLTATGISAMNGKQDQIIRVKNIRSNKYVFCKVSSPGIVEVQI